LVSLALYVNAAEQFRFAHPFRSFSAPDGRHIIKLAKLGLPIALAIFFEVSVFTLVSLFIGSLGARVVASHQITLNIASLSFMVPLSIAMALTIRVGEGVGAANVQMVAQRSVTGLCLSFFIACFAAAGMAGFADSLTAIYTQEPDIRQLAAELLTWAAIFQISDAMQANANGCLRGFKDTTAPMYLTLLAYWCIGMPSGYILGMTHFLTSPLGANGFWIGLVIGLTCAAGFLLIRLRTTFKRWAVSPSPTP
ncbi:MAG TPA: MATE family efflux transporter, partial [Pseudomonadales bacterium]|nr:MATE family efflux transporter [Pseudomonadales bacterium]